MSITDPAPLPFATFPLSPSEAAGALLFLAAVAGHAVLLIRSHNTWYGTGLGRRMIDLVQWVHAVLLLAGPAAIWFVLGFDLRPPFHAADPSPAFLPVAIYVVLCWLALVVFALITVWRLVRPRPAVLESNHTRTIDVAAELGYKPVGRGGRRFLACLPGNQVFQVDITEKTLRLKRLPAAWDGLSILHFSDVHFTGTPDRDYFRRVMDLCAAWGPDLVAFTGDTVDTDVHYRWIVPLFGRLKSRCGAFAILGNHDSYFEPALVRRRLGRAGMRVLGNTWTQIEVRGEPLVVIGHEGPWFGTAPDLSACPSGPFRLCLSHTPDNIGWARRQGIDLMLAGHVHGGQIRLPLIGSVVIPSRYGRRYDCGTFDEPPTVLHVSRGLGGDQPLRFNCRPEVSKLILRPA
ncbi:MAG TPA: metallophosphoesterase [Gemmataceae bacterium]|nr:metallophosphoesterase [Gemmataceae bacterium]